MGEGAMEDDRGVVIDVRGCVDPGWDGDVELHKGRYWGVSLCASVGTSGGVDSSAGVGGADGVGSGSFGSVGGGGGNSDRRRGVGGS